MAVLVWPWRVLCSPQAAEVMWAAPQETESCPASCKTAISSAGLNSWGCALQLNLHQKKKKVEVTLTFEWVMQAPPGGGLEGKMGKGAPWNRWGGGLSPWPWFWQISARGLPWWLSGKDSACQCRRRGFNPWSRKIPHALEQLSPCTTATEPVL